MTSRSRLLLPLLLTGLFASTGVAFWFGVSTIFLASFAGVPDGPGNGISYPAEIGALFTYTGNGQPFLRVSPGSGIDSEKLVLTDAGGDPTVDVGVYAIPTMWAAKGACLSFEVRFGTDTTDFSVNVTDVTGIDISRVSFDGGDVNINGKKTVGGTKDNLDYRVDIYLAPKATGKDVFVVLLTDLATGRLVGSWNGLIPGGYRPVGSATFTKCGTAPGTVTLDAIKIRATE